MADEPLRNLPEQMVARVASKDAVVTVCIVIFLEILVSLNQRFGIFERVLWMNIVVGRAMTDEQ